MFIVQTKGGSRHGQLSNKIMRVTTTELVKDFEISVGKQMRAQLAPLFRELV